MTRSHVDFMDFHLRPQTYQRRQGKCWMSELVNSIAVLGRPYKITRSRLGAITKVYTDQYSCDLKALKEVFQVVADKLAPLSGTESPEFSFLISFDDKTHYDGVLVNLQATESVPIGKRTDRVVMRWAVNTLVDGQPNELSVTVRISNPMNPLLFLQAALSKSPGDVDNLEFEMGSTCVTVDGADQGFADEVFLRIQNWINARKKAYPVFELHTFYLKWDWWFQQINHSLLPLLLILITSIYIQRLDPIGFFAYSPALFGGFMVLRSFGMKLDEVMEKWARRAGYLPIFEITNGDSDHLTKLVASSKNSVLKLGASALFSFSLNVVAAYFCFKVIGI